MAKGQHFLYVHKTDGYLGTTVKIKEYVYNTPARAWKWETTRVNGGGYDMLGTVLGDWLASHYQKELHALYLETLQGREYKGILYGHDDSVFVDGSYGLSRVYEMMEAIGLKVYEDFTDKGIQMWFVLDKEEA